MIRLKQSEFQKAAPLLDKLSHHTVIGTLLCGSTQGNIYLDDLENPELAYAQFRHRAFFSGSLPDPLRSSLPAFVRDTIYPNCKEAHVPLFRLATDSPSLLETIAEALDDYQPILSDYQIYQIDLSESPPTCELPEGFSLSELDKTFLQRDFAGKGELLEEMCSERDSVKAFLKDSFGIVAMYGDALAGWCLSEYNHDRTCEVGIATMPQFRRLGLATQMTYAFLQLGANKGYATVRWHCDKRNVPSKRTAVSTGFTQIQEETVLIIYLDRAIHFGVKGNLRFEAQEYAQALTWYDKAIAQGDHQPWVVWNAAGAAAKLNEIDLAFYYLNLAFDLGLTNANRLLENPHLAVLRGDRRWAELITRMTANHPS